ncbi:MAG: mechanosensitive ion channel [Magnetococcales bacterium]|nr:mechanosensitive ion channel [Magnetococcales bacterium]
MRLWLFLWLTILGLIASVPLYGEPPPPTTRPVWEVDNLSLAILAVARTETEASISQIPNDAKESSPEGLMRIAYKTRLSLLAELEESIKRQLVLKKDAPELLASDTEITAAITRFRKPLDNTPIERPTNESFESLREKLKASSAKLEERKRQMRERTDIMQGITDRTSKTRDRQREAQRNEEKLRNLLASANPQDNRGVLSVRIENEKLSQRVATEILKELDAEQEFEKQTVGIRDRLLELAQLETDRLQHEVANYQEALNKVQHQALKDQNAEVHRKDAAVENATSKDALFLATWEAHVARLKRNVTSYTALLNDIGATLSEQEEKLKSEREDLKSLRALVGKGSELNEMSSEIFKNTYHRTANTRKEIQAGSESGDLEQRIKEAKGRHYDIVALMPTLRSQWQKELQKASEGLSESQVKSFIEKAEKVFNAYRSQLAEEKGILLEISLRGQRLKILPIERKEVLAELETFVLSRIFWVQDDLPISLNLIGPLWKELFALDRPYSLLNWWMEVLSLETLTTLLRFFQTGLVAFWVALMLVILPLVLFWLHRHIRRAANLATSGLDHRFVRADSFWIPAFAGMTKKSPEIAVVCHSRESGNPDGAEASSMRFGRNDDQGPTSQGDGHGKPGKRRLQLLAITLGPLYLLALAMVIDAAGFPAALGTVVTRTLIHMAVFFFLWRLNVFLLRPPAILAVSWGIPGEVCHELYRALRLALLASLAFLLPWRIFSPWPFHFEILPRLGMTLFQITVMVAIYRLIRLRSSLVQSFLRIGDNARILADNWNMITLPAISFMVLIVIMDLTGYRFGARYLAVNGLLSFVTIVAMTGMVRLIAVTGAKMRQRQDREQLLNVSGKTGHPRTEHLAVQMQGPLSWMVFAGGTILLASYWGINESVIRSLSDVTLYSVTGADGQIQFVSLADWSSFLFCLFLVFWLAKRLPHLFNWFLFSRMNTDPGMRYAVVTMTRYLVVLTGIFVAFSFLKLDLAKIGWLAAAISVGLGFGLQEIVANFVSGIILLVERPIRVDDLITVGSMSGHITRINIRATTLRNFDQQEILIPNKQLITQEVTNWTLGDTRIRLVIPIGVAYGSDVDRVSALLMELAKSLPEVLPDPHPEVYFLSHAASSLDFEVRVFLSHPDLRLPTRDRLNKLINKRFKLENIEIPFPQTDIHIRSGLESLVASPKPIPHTP